MYAIRKEKNLFKIILKVVRNVEENFLFMKKSKLEGMIYLN